jgi:hypothetical protein
MKSEIHIFGIHLLFAKYFQSFQSYPYHMLHYGSSDVHFYWLPTYAKQYELIETGLGKRKSQTANKQYVF